MKYLEEIVRYTIDKKKQQLKKEEYFFVEPTNELELFVQDKEDDSVVGLNLDFLSSWEHYIFIYSFSSSNSIDYSKIARSTILGIESNNWDYLLGKIFPKFDSSILFHNAIKHMAQALLLGWDHLAIAYGKLLIEMLYGKQYKGWHKAYKHPWFMLEVFCKWQNIALDYAQLNMPEDMAVYTDILANWDSNDTELVNDLVDKMCDYHIAQSDEDEYRDRTPDFPSADYFVYAIEILLWLNIRSRMGLADYSGRHPLMELAINNWHTQQTEIPKIELVDRAKKKLLEDYPEVSFPLAI